MIGLVIDRICFYDLFFISKVVLEIFCQISMCVMIVLYIEDTSFFVVFTL